MFKKIASFLIFAVLLGSNSYAQISKHLVYKYTGDNFEKDGQWLHAVSPNGRFIVLGCGSYAFSRKTNLNICAAWQSELSVYDTYEKKLNSIKLTSNFGASTGTLFYTFDQHSHLYLANTEVDLIDGDDFLKVNPYFKQALLKIDLSTSKIEGALVFDEGKVCTQLAYYADQLICSQNTIRKIDDRFTNDLNIIFYDSNLSKVLKTVSISKDKDYVMIPSLDETETITDRASYQDKILVVAENLGNGLHTTGDSFSIDKKSANILLITELDFPEPSMPYKQHTSIERTRFLGNNKASGASIFLLGYYAPQSPVKFLVVGDKSVVLIDAPNTWGNWDTVSYNTIGLKSDENTGLPMLFRQLSRKFEESDDYQLSILSYSLFTGAETTIAQFDFKGGRVHRDLVWDDYSSGFYLLNWIQRNKAGQPEVFDSEIQQVGLDGKVIQSTVIPKLAAKLYLNPKSINPILLGYGFDETPSSEFGSAFVYSPIKRKETFIEKAPLAVHFGAYATPIFASHNSMALISGDGANDAGYEIYYYEYR